MDGVQMFIMELFQCTSKICVLGTHMSSQGDIEQQQQLLATYRRTLAHLLRQAAQYGGEVFAPPATANGIAEARASIQNTKTVLRKLGVAVADHSDDSAKPPVSGIGRTVFSPQPPKTSRPSIPP